MPVKRPGEDGSDTRYKRHDKVLKIRGPDEVVLIKIPSGQQYRIHAQLLAQYSGYFLKSLNSCFAESRTREFSLVEHATERSMTILLEWAYGRRYLKGQKLLVKVLMAFGPEEFVLEDLYEAWLLADYLQVPELQNDIMTYMDWQRDDLANPSRGLADLLALKPPSGSSLHDFHTMLLAARIRKLGGNDSERIKEAYDKMDRETLAEVAFYLTMFSTTKGIFGYIEFSNLLVEDIKY